MNALRISGLQRVGIVLSFTWFFVGGFWANSDAINFAQTLADRQLNSCVEEHKQRLGETAPFSQTWDPCWAQFPNDYARNAEGHWKSALVAGLVPIPSGWLLAWGAIALYRWVRRGFSNDHISN